MPGYENGVEFTSLVWLLMRLMLALYLVASALAAYDMKPLSLPWVVIRLVAAVAIMVRPETVHMSAVVASLAILAWHHFDARRAAAQSA